jgi:two-component system nitrogen regulation sensor histidine kinase GlnL
LALLDEDLRVLWMNDAMAELVDVGTRNLRGQPFSGLVESADFPAAAECARRGAAVGLRNVRMASLQEREFLADLALQVLDGGRLLLEVHALAPATAATPLSATLRGFAHEVKNPLAGLRGAAQLLQRRAADDESRQLAALVIAEADRLAALADGLLRNDGKARLARVNVHELLDRLADLLRAEPGAPRVVQDYDPSLPSLFGDGGRLQQLLLNLARNAVDAGAHALSLRTRAEHGVRLDARVLRVALRVDVADDGNGVPEALRETLFQPLVSGRADGNGLGLALAREIAREHGGDLRYTSRVGATVFSLYLPMESDS